MSHYYSDQPTAPSREQSVIFEVNGRSFACVTDSGVFGRSGLDMGSRILARTFAADAPNCTTALELGCGWGALALAVLAYRPELEMVLVDINERACGLARKNLEKHRFSAQIIHGDATLTALPNTPAVLMNPPIRAGNVVVHALLTRAHALLVPGGQLFFVVRKQQGAPSMQRFCAELFGNCHLHVRESGYWVLSCLKTQ